MSKVKTSPKPRRGSPDMQTRRAPAQTDVPGTDADRDPMLELCGRELEAADDEIKVQRTILVTAKLRAAKRLAAIGKTVYRTSNGRLLSAEPKVVVKLSPAKKKKVKVE